MKKKIKRFLATICCATILLSSVASAFTDLSPSHWAYNAVNKIQQNGIITGFNDGSFRPDDLVTKEQLATILVKTLGITKTDYEYQFDDILSDRWSKPYVELVGAYIGYVDKDGKKTFGPTVFATREMVVRTIVYFTDINQQSPDYSLLEQFTDTDEMDESEKSNVALVVQNGIMNGNANGSFNLFGDITRAEIAVVINKLIDKNIIASEYYRGTDFKHVLDNNLSIDNKETNNYTSDISDFYIDTDSRMISWGTNYSKYRVAFVNEKDDAFKDDSRIEWYKPIMEVEQNDDYYPVDENGNYEPEEVMIETYGFMDLTKRPSWAITKDYIFIKKAKALDNDYERFYIGEDYFLPEFNTDMGRIVLGEDYYKYEMSLSHTYGPGKWYTPSTEENSEIRVSEDGEFLFDNRPAWANSLEYMYLRQKNYADKGYRKFYIGTLDGRTPIKVEPTDVIVDKQECCSICGALLEENYTCEVPIHYRACTRNPEHKNYIEEVLMGIYGQCIDCPLDDTINGKKYVDMEYYYDEYGYYENYSVDICWDMKENLDFYTISELENLQCIKDNKIYFSELEKLSNDEVNYINIYVNGQCIDKEEKKYIV